jgi:hypothetical protein
MDYWGTEDPVDLVEGDRRPKGRRWIIEKKEDPPP